VTAFRSPAHLPEIAGLAAAVRPDLDREQWTTCYVGSLNVGEVFALPDALQVRPVVLTATRVEDVPGQTYGWVIGEARHIDTGEPAEFKLRANQPVPARCDLHYTIKEES
jgi:hypothetical protein